MVWYGVGVASGRQAVTTSFTLPIDNDDDLQLPFSSSQYKVYKN